MRMETVGHRDSLKHMALSRSAITIWFRGSPRPIHSRCAFDCRLSRRLFGFLPTLSFCPKEQKASVLIFQMIFALASCVFGVEIQILSSWV